MRSLSDHLMSIISPHVPDDAELEFVELDLLKDEGWDEAMKGCVYVQHVAAPISLNVPKDLDAFVPGARDGTLRALRAAKANGIKRVVATSSLGTVTYGPKAIRIEFLPTKIESKLQGNQCLYPSQDSG